MYVSLSVTSIELGVLLTVSQEEIWDTFYYVIIILIWKGTLGLTL